MEKDRGRGGLQWWHSTNIRQNTARGQGTLHVFLLSIIGLCAIVFNQRQRKIVELHCCGNLQIGLGNLLIVTKITSTLDF